VGWVVFGLLLLWGALQVRRGGGIEIGYPLAVFAGAWFLLGEAVPRVLAELAVMARGPAQPVARPSGEKRLTTLAARTRRLTRAGTILILAGQIAASEGAVRGGAVIWLAAAALLFAPPAGGTRIARWRSR
jgi:hypothetical protein